MRNPFKSDHPDHERDNPAVPDAVERPVERAAGRAAAHDNPIIPNAIERPVERSLADDRGAVVNRAADRPGIDERSMNDSGTRYRSDDRPLDGSRPTPRTPSADESVQIDLFPDEELTGYRTRWDTIQTGFVDEPRAAVEQADALVSQVVNRLTEVFSRERASLEGQWSRGDNVSTEDLRVALRRYRSFFHRLLSM